MATTVGALNIQMGLGTAKFTKGTKQVTGGLGRIGKAAGVAGVALVAFAGAKVIGRVIGRLKDLVVEQLNVVDAMAKLSDRTGFATESLAALTLAAKISGTETDTLNRSLEIFTKRIGETALGIGEAKAGFEALGLSVDQMLKLSAIEQFKLVAEGIKNLGTQAEKAAVANLLFGRSGAGLVNLFDAGAAAIAKAAAETERFGTAISRTDAAKIEEANDAITRLGELLDGIIRQITVDLAPAIENFTESLAAATAAGGGFGEVVTFAINGLTVAWEALSGGVNFFISVAARAAAGVVQILRLVPFLSGELESLDGILTEIADGSWQRFIESGDRVVDILNGVTEAAEKTNKAFDDIAITDILGDGVGALEEIGDSFDKLVADRKALDDTFDKFVGGFVPLKVNLNAGKDLFDKVDLPDPFTPGQTGDNRALTRGSSEAVSFLNRQQSRQPLKTLEQINKDQLEVQKRMEQELKRDQERARTILLQEAF